MSLGRFSKDQVRHFRGRVWCRVVQDVQDRRKGYRTVREEWLTRGLSNGETTLSLYFLIVSETPEPERKLKTDLSRGLVGVPTEGKKKSRGECIVPSHSGKTIVKNFNIRVGDRPE